jgi:hypothetical protein
LCAQKTATRLARPYATRVFQQQRRTFCASKGPNLRAARNTEQARPSPKHTVFVCEALSNALPSSQPLFCLQRRQGPALRGRGMTSACAQQQHSKPQAEPHAPSPLPASAAVLPPLCTRVAPRCSAPSQRQPPPEDPKPPTEATPTFRQHSKAAAAPSSSTRSSSGTRAQEQQQQRSPLPAVRRPSR